MTKEYSERDLYNQTKITIIVKESAIHKVLKRVGFWIMKVGLRIAGIGEVEIKDKR